MEPGLAGRDFSFDQSGDVFEALAWSYPHVDEAWLEQTVRVGARTEEASRSVR
ncbi:MAG TPA: hypothetical protein PKM73_11215 [Verrucomicrobiota bacterium]|nr:hypothetical protein [Verrucomicrobiota bacterium]